MKRKGKGRRVLRALTVIGGYKLGKAMIKDVKDKKRKRDLEEAIERHSQAVQEYFDYKQRPDANEETLAKLIENIEKVFEQSKQ